MREDALRLEDGRLEGLSFESYPWFHERHRLFPEVFKVQQYDKVLDIAAGIGVVGKRIHDHYPCTLICNDISKESLRSLREHGLSTVSFDLDNPETRFPFPDQTFDAIISLATLEHIMHMEHHLKELMRVLKTGGHLYISTPNYNGIHFVLPFLTTGKTFHDPMKKGIHEYEFYAHVRYFTYVTMLEYVASFGFKPEKVFLPLPEASSRFTHLRNKSRLLAMLFKTAMLVLYKSLHPRWAFHPVLLFSKCDDLELCTSSRPRKVVL